MVECEDIFTFNSNTHRIAGIEGGFDFNIRVS